MTVTPVTVLVEAIEDFDAYGVQITAGTQLYVTGDPYRVCSDDEVCVSVPGSNDRSVGVPVAKVIAIA